MADLQTLRHLTGGRLDDEELDDLQAWHQRQVSKEVALLRSDIARAIGPLQGLGYPDKYLEERYPDIGNPKENTNGQ